MSAALGSISVTAPPFVITPQAPTSAAAVQVGSQLLGPSMAQRTLSAKVPDLATQHLHALQVHSEITEPQFCPHRAILPDMDTAAHSPEPSE